MRDKLYENIIKIDEIDVDEKAINEAKNNFLNNNKYSFELKNIDDLESNNKYDIINLSYVLQHLENHILKEIFSLYENEIMRKSSITKYTDRHIGKKVYNYLSQSQYSDINLYYSITDTVGKTEEEKEKLFESSIAFRSGKGKENIPEEIKEKMEVLLYSTQFNRFILI